MGIRTILETGQPDLSKKKYLADTAQSAFFWWTHERTYLEKLRTGGYRIFFEVSNRAYQYGSWEFVTAGKSQLMRNAKDNKAEFLNCGFGLLLIYFNREYWKNSRRFPIIRTAIFALPEIKNDCQLQAMIGRSA